MTGIRATAMAVLACLACLACSGTAWAASPATGPDAARVAQGTSTPTHAQAAQSAARVRALTAHGIATLLTPPGHGARLLAVWALDCAYCEPNLEALARLQRTHPADFELVTVATDSISQGEAVAARLRQAGVANYPAYAYAEATPERLNFLLDPQWGGETPRVILLRANGSRTGVSGELTPVQLHKLLGPQP